MKNKGIIAAVVALLIVAGVVVAMTVNKPNKETTTNTTSSTTVPKSSQSTTTNSQNVNANEVSISNFAFSPGHITVKVGTKVTWTNNESIGHTITADVLSPDAPASQLVDKGKTYSFTFNKAGTYSYHCQIHPDMKGTVTVTE